MLATRDTQSVSRMSETPPHFNPQLNNGKVACADELARQMAHFAAPITRALLDAIPGMVLVLNRYRQIIFANRVFGEISGRSGNEDVLGSRVGDVLSCHISAAAESGCGTGDACRTCGALMAMMTSREEERVQECTLTRQDDGGEESLTLRVWSEGLCCEGEDYTILIGMDVSHERRRLALERTFFHDVLNLIGSIHGFAELMEIEQDVDTVEVSRRIRQASQRVVDEIDSQRVLLAVEKGELELDNRLLSSREILHDLLDLYEGQEVARRRVLRIDPETEDFGVISDATLLRRILGNMVKNALEASPAGESVTLGAALEGDGACFWVHNTAVIPESYRQRIFQRDFSTKGSGRGLGTYSMKLLGRFLSGDVFFTSEPGEGTRFFLRLPRLRQ